MAKDDDDGMQRKKGTLAKLTALVASVQNVLVAMLGDGAQGVVVRNKSGQKSDIV